MSTWKEVRRVARQKHGEVAKGCNDLLPAAVILKAAESATGIKIMRRPAGDALLEGAEATYDRERKRIYYSAATPELLAQFHIAHEFAHALLWNRGRHPGEGPEIAADSLAAEWGFPRPTILPFL